MMKVEGIEWLLLLMVKYEWLIYLLWEVTLLMVLPHFILSYYKKSCFESLLDLYPEKFNKTNGITPRRWLLGCNPQLAELVNTTIGTEWISNSSLLRGLGKYADDSSFRQKFGEIKYQNKVNLVNLIKSRFDLEISPDAVFDVQIKRLHEYKRQHLNLLHILTLYRRLLQNPELKIPPRVFIFGAKAVLWLSHG